MGPRNRFQGMNSASLCSLAGRYDNPLPPRFLAPIAAIKIPALAGQYNNPIPTLFLSTIDRSKIRAQVTHGNLYRRSPERTPIGQFCAKVPAQNYITFLAVSGLWHIQKLSYSDVKLLTVQVNYMTILLFLVYVLIVCTKAIKPVLTAENTYFYNSVRTFEFRPLYVGQTSCKKTFYPKLEYLKVAPHKIL
jgi:hypothetical protein